MDKKTMKLLRKLMFDAYNAELIEEAKEAGLETDWKTGEEVLSWWFGDKRKELK